MNVSKIFGLVLGLHFSVIAVILFQPGCRSKQPPTRTYTQVSTIEKPEQLASEELISTTGFSAADDLDAAFNASFDDFDSYTDKAVDKSTEVDETAPLVAFDSTSQTVEVTGASFESYVVTKGDSLWSIATRYNVPIKELYKINGLDSESVLNIGQKIQIPVASTTAQPLTLIPDNYQPTSLNKATVRYTVDRGDTLSSIAKLYNSSIREIKAINGKLSDLIRIGEIIIIPVIDGVSSANTDLSVPSATSNPTVSINVSEASTHTVRAGEYLSTIASQYGMTVEELIAINGVTNPRRLQIGQVLKVTGIDTTASTSVSDSATDVADLPIPASSPITITGPEELIVVESNPVIESVENEIESDDVFDDAENVPVFRITD